MDAFAAEQPIEFSCPYCGQQALLAATLAGCVASCAGCGRDVLVPERDPWLAPTTPPRVWNTLWTPLSVMLWGTLGAVTGCVLLANPVSLAAMRVIGVGAQQVAIAALAGGLLGAFFGGLLGYRMRQD